ncbi:MAG: hypothetical protein R6V35_04265, partial [Candidatus Nanohaloarchaea archaeon]
MKAWKSLALLTAYIFLAVTVSAQGLGGAEMTVEESLTTFVTEVLGFPVADVSEVILFVVGPIFAFYFFLTNMMTMAFENFEDRIGRDEWDKKEELPTNLKLFSLVTAFITVVTIGRVAPGLIMVFGALALILGILMMTGLLTRDENGNNGGGSEEDAGDTGGGADNNGNGATRGGAGGGARGAPRRHQSDHAADRLARAGTGSAEQALQHVADVDDDGARRRGGPVALLDSVLPASQPGFRHRNPAAVHHAGKPEPLSGTDSVG